MWIGTFSTLFSTPKPLEIIDCLFSSAARINGIMSLKCERSCILVESPSGCVRSCVQFDGGGLCDIRNLYVCIYNENKPWIPLVRIKRIPSLVFECIGKAHVYHIDPPTSGLDPKEWQHRSSTTKSRNSRERRISFMSKLIKARNRSMFVHLKIENWGLFIF